MTLAALREYIELVTQFPLLSIQNHKQLTAAIEMIETLLNRESISAGAQQYLAALTDLVELYETHPVRIAPATDGGMLQHLMHSADATQAEVVAGTGIHKSTISEILSDKRTLSRANVQKVAEFFGVSTRLFADIKR